MSDCIPMCKCYLWAHLDHQALPTAYFFSFQPYIQNTILFSLHSSNKVSYMSDAGVACVHSRFVIVLTAGLDNLHSRLIRNTILQTISVYFGMGKQRQRSYCTGSITKMFPLRGLLSSDRDQLFLTYPTEQDPHSPIHLKMRQILPSKYIFLINLNDGHCPEQWLIYYKIQSPGFFKANVWLFVFVSCTTAWQNFSSLT